MKRIARTQPIAALAQRLSLPDDIASRLRLYEDEEPSLNGRTHMTLEFVEQRGTGKKLREIAVASRYADVARMNEVLESNEEIATFIDLAVGASGQKDKPELPALVQGYSVAKDTRQFMRRASKMATYAATATKRSIL